MDINAISIGPNPPKDVARDHRNPAGRRAGEVRARQGVGRAEGRSVPAHRHVLSRQLRLHPAYVVGRRRSLRRAGGEPGAGGAGRHRALPAGRCADDGRRSGRRRERSSRCRSTRSRRSIRIFAATAICRRSCASRSRISSSTTRIWKRANGSRSSSGSTRRAPKSSCSTRLRAPPRRKRGTKSREVPHQRQSGQQAADRERDGKNDVERRKAKLAALVEQDGIERER